MSFTVGGILSRIGSGNWTANLQCVNETDESARIIDIVLDNNRSRVTFAIIQASIIFRYYFIKVAILI